MSEDRHRVDLDKLKEALLFIDLINAVPLDSIDWINNGDTVPVKDDEVNDFRYTGLSNATFARLAILDMG